MTKIFFWFTTLAVILPIAAFSQKPTREDSLLFIARLKDDTNAVNARVELFWEYSNMNVHKAKAHLDTASTLQSLSNYINGQADINRAYGVYYHSVGLYDKAEKYFNTSKDLYQQTGNKVGIVHCINALGILEGERGNFKKALEYYLLVERGNSELGDEKAMARAKINIGLVYNKMGNLKKADDYYEKAYRIFKKYNDLNGLMHVYSKRATNYLDLKEYSLALDHLHKSKDLARQLKDSTQQLVIEQNIGSYYLRIGKPDTALIQFYNYKALSEKMGFRKDIAIAQLYIGLGEYKLGNAQKAIQATEDGVRIAGEVGDKWRMMNGYDLLAEIHKSQGNYKLAFEFNELKEHLKDSLKGVEVNNKINELQSIYNLEEKESENRILQEQNKLKQAEVKQLYTLTGGLAVLFLSIGVLGLLYSRQKKIKTKLIQTELEQQVLRVQMNPHFIFNALNSIQWMYLKDQKESANKYLADFSKLLRSILENSGRQYIKLREELELTKLYLDLEKLRTDNLFDYEISIHEDLDPTDILFPPLILQPYLENAIWHGIIPNDKKGVICIKIIPKDETAFIIEITDNGIGINKSRERKKEITKSSLGMQITSRRLGKKEHVKVEELAEGGTKISLTIKYS